MADALSDQSLSLISKSVADQAGLYFPRERWRDLERGIQSVARRMEYPDAESCVRFLLSGPLNRKQLEILAGELTVGETYFFREKRSFEIVADRILPEITRIRRGSERRLRIWSAGCCTGEEPYSIAILLDRVLPDLRQWHVTILATDLNPHFLQKASEGVFSEWSFRDTPPWLKENYFNQIDKNRFEIVPRIKERVTFAYLNLAEDVYPCLSNNTNAMDLVFCRNVLMYFSPAGMKRVIDQFYRSLVDGGWLLVSPTETSSELFSLFSTVQLQDSILYRKGGRQSPMPPVSRPMETPAVSRIEDDPAVAQPIFDFIPAYPGPAPASPPVAEPQVMATKLSPYEEALALFERGSYAEAAGKLEDDPTLSRSAESLALLARIRANLGELAEARSWVEKAINADKLDAGLHYLRATILQEQGIYEEGKAALKRALYLDPDFVMAYFGLGTLALRQKNFEEAHKYLLNVLGLLADYQGNDVLPQSDGLFAGRLKEMTLSAMSMERAYA